MFILVRTMVIGMAALMCGCTYVTTYMWQRAVSKQISKLGYQNWIVVAESSFPAMNQRGVTQVQSNFTVPLALDYVLREMEQTENVRPQIFITRELNSVPNDLSPGIEQMRTQLDYAMHGYQPMQLDQQALVALLTDANKNYNILVVRTQTAMPYSSVFVKLLPSYWDENLEGELRQRIEKGLRTHSKRR